MPIPEVLRRVIWNPPLEAQENGIFGISVGRDFNRHRKRLRSNTPMTTHIHGDTGEQNAVVDLAAKPLRDCWAMGHEQFSGYLGWI